MHRIYSALIEIAAASIFIIPIFSIYGKCRIHDVKRTCKYIVFGFYLVAVLALVGFPGITSMNLDLTVNVIPFVDMVTDFVNAGLNVLLFVPLGIFLPMLWDRYRDIRRTMLVAFCMTVGIEFSQIFTFRTTDINDVITNMVGTLVGYFVAKGITKNFTRYIKSNVEHMDLYFVCGIVALIMFLLQPFVSTLLWEVVKPR